MLCNYCGETLNSFDEENFGNINVKFLYGSKRDGDTMTFSLCSKCADKLTDRFMAECKHEPAIKDLGLPNWEVRRTEEADYQ